MNTPAPQLQRNALAPGLLGAIALFISPLFPDGFGSIVVRFFVAVLAVVVAWFAVQAGQWWWTVVFGAVAVVWNPVFPFYVDGTVWAIAQVVGALLFIVAGALIKNERTVDGPNRTR